MGFKSMPCTVLRIWLINLADNRPRITAVSRAVIDGGILKREQSN